MKVLEGNETKDVREEIITREEDVKKEPVWKITYYGIVVLLSHIAAAHFSCQYDGTTTIHE